MNLEVWILGNKNTTLHAAKTAKKDEFYTQYEDIQKELNHYEAHFKGKTVLCNADDPFESNFCKFFLRNFNYLGLKRLICTSYNESPVAGTQISLFDLIEGKTEEGHGYVLDVSKVPMANGRGVSDADIDNLLRSKKYVKELKGNGDFRSDECIEYLKQADIVVTNPPFSLFREYVAQLMQYEKKFLIIGSQNAITYKEVFPLLKDNKMWLGFGFSGNVGFFKTPYEDTAKSSQHKDGFIRVSGVMWFTNLDHTKRHEKLILYKSYNPLEYPTYDNYDAINVDKVTDIPKDYDEVMGVPITFMDKFNPEQFEIVGMDGQECSPPTKTYSHKEKVVDGKRMKSQTGTMGCVSRTPSFGKGTYFDVGYPVKAYYKRIFIRRKQ